MKARAEAQAVALRDGLTASYLSQMTGGQANRAVMTAYMKNFVGDSKHPQDPVERVMLESLALAHVRLGKLQVQADGATTQDSQKILNTAALRFMGEIRKTALAIRQYRQTVVTRQFSVVHQQNIATGAKQDVRYVDQSIGSQDEVSFSSRTEVEGMAKKSGGQQEDLHEDNDVIVRPQVAGAGSGGANQRAQATALGA